MPHNHQIGRSIPYQLKEKKKQRIFTFTFVDSLHDYHIGGVALPPLQGDYVGFNSENADELSSSQAAGLPGSAWL